MNEDIIVGIGDLAVAKSSNRLVTYTLGSCVGICLYDSQCKVAGLAHIVLPSMHLSNSDNSFKFADTAIPIMIKKMTRLGAHSRRIVAKIAGGASMMPYEQKAGMAIGEKNIAMVKQVLEQEKIRLVAEDVGLSHSRSLYMEVDSGIVTVKSSLHQITVL